jgi:uncharacterized membrane protein (DUF4010 family)
MNTAISLTRVEWPYAEAMVRLTLALALGLLIGLERERNRKEAGLRTFALIALLGSLGGAMSSAFALASLGFAALMAAFLNLHTMRSGQGVELTTSAALLVTCATGILCGQGHRLTPAAVTVITTALLAWKQPLSGFTMGLKESEVRSAVLLAILAIVIYPALPEGAVGPGNVVEPRAAWLTVLLIAGIGFVNYVLWKLYNTRGTEAAGFLGGLVNSTVTVNELAARAGEAGDAFVDTAYRGILLATAAMIIRNAVLLGILAPAALGAVVLPHALMLLVCAVLIAARLVRARVPQQVRMGESTLELPFSLRTALKYGSLFLLLHVIGVLAQRYGGDSGFLAVSFLGGLVSSASAVAAAASLADNGSVSNQLAGIGALVASVTSVMVNLPFMLRARNVALMKKVTIAMAAISTVGLAASLWVSVGGSSVTSFLLHE